MVQTNNVNGVESPEGFQLSLLRVPDQRERTKSSLALPRLARRPFVVLVSDLQMLESSVQKLNDKTVP